MLSKKIVFLCGARDYHAMDWYRSAEEVLPKKSICILTDLIAGEGFKKIVTKDDDVKSLLILDKFLFKGQSNLGNLWRNILKLIVLPVQIILLKNFAKKNPETIYYAHSMYYLWLAAGAKVPFIGTPQGSDILVKPFKSLIYRKLSIWALKSAKNVTVDSIKMRDKAFELSGIKSEIIQNGIDIKSIELFLSTQKQNQQCKRNKIVSIRGITPLYRIENLLLARQKLDEDKKHSISFIYPFYEDEYKQVVLNYFNENDKDLGRISRKKMYELLFESKLVISIPLSDSSPRSVYESIFCGSAVAIAHHSYYDFLPDCMKKRIILVDLEDKNWLVKAINKADSIVKCKFVPSKEALDMFDQRRCFTKIIKLIDNYEKRISNLY